MKTVDTTIILVALLAVVAPSAAFAPSSASRTAIRRSRGEEESHRRFAYVIISYATK